MQTSKTRCAFGIVASIRQVYGDQLKNIWSSGRNGRAHASQTSYQ